MAMAAIGLNTNLVQSDQKRRQTNLFGTVLLGRRRICILRHADSASSVVKNKKRRIFPPLFDLFQLFFTFFCCRICPFLIVAQHLLKFFCVHSVELFRRHQSHAGRQNPSCLMYHNTFHAFPMPRAFGSTGTIWILQNGCHLNRSFPKKAN